MLASAGRFPGFKKHPSPALPSGTSLPLINIMVRCLRFMYLRYVLHVIVHRCTSCTVPVADFWYAVASGESGEGGLVGDGWLILSLRIRNARFGSVAEG